MRRIRNQRFLAAGRRPVWFILASMPNVLSVVLITFNEAANLPRTLASVRWAQELVIVDSGSTDGTREIARDAGARVFEESWKGFAAQKNSAIAHATGDWILSLDADEEVSPELAREIQALLAAEPPCAAYRVPRLNHFLGKPLRHGGYWPDPKLRLFRRGAARFEDRPVHETMTAEGAVGALQGHLIHHCYPTLDDYIEHMNRYSAVAAQMLVASGRAPRSLPGFCWNAILNPAATFIYNYVFRLGFLDGRHGFLQHLNHSVYIHWKYAKAWQAARDAGPRPT
ncbi:MAG: glycosyltransferase family 2 protein [Acidobacteriota bacterium]